MNNKRMIAMLTLLCFMVTFMPMAVFAANIMNNPFTDVKESDWFYSDVMYVYETGMMAGTSDDTFSPEDAVTGSMIASVLYRMEGSLDDTMAVDNVLKSYRKEKFDADTPLTREQLVVMLYNYAEYKGYDLSVGENTNILSYNDFMEISEDAISSVQWACGAGIISGRADGMLVPQGEAKRCEAAAMLHRCVNWMEGQ